MGIYLVGFTGSDAAMILRATDFCEEKPFIRNVPNGDDIKKQLIHIYDARVLNSKMRSK